MLSVLEDVTAQHIKLTGLGEESGKALVGVVGLALLSEVAIGL